MSSITPIIFVLAIITVGPLSYLAYRKYCKKPVRTEEESSYPLLDIVTREETQTDEFETKLFLGSEEKDPLTDSLLSEFPSNSLFFENYGNNQVLYPCDSDTSSEISDTSSDSSPDTSENKIKYYDCKSEDTDSILNDS